MIKVGDVFESECVDVDFDGKGVFKIEEYILFAEGALKGENCRIEVTQISKNFGFANLEKRLSRSPFRVSPECPYFDECGGCNLMHMDYKVEGDYKKHIVKDTIMRIGGIDCFVNNTIMMNDYQKYRNNVQIPVSYNGKIVMGFYEKKSHKVVDMKDCLIAPECTGEIIQFIRKIVGRGNMPKHLVIRENKAKEIMIIFVTNKIAFDRSLAELVVNKFPNVVSVLQNVNPNSRTVLSDKEIILYGKPYLVEEILGLKFQVGGHSFMQVNNVQMEKLYQTVFDYAHLRATDVVIDAYCGIGTMSLLMASKVNHVYGIEIVASAIENANRNKEINKIENATFILGAAEEKIAMLADEKIDCLIVDPPRKGCEEIFLQSVVKARIPRVVYVSCNVRTLARDLKYLVAQGYTVSEVTPVDMFPRSVHVECVTALNLRKSL